MKFEIFNDKNNCYAKEFVGLRPKMYAFKLDNKTEKKVHKGVKKSARLTDGSEITFKEYKRVLEEKTSNEVIQYGFVSKKHSLFTVKSHKTGLSYFDTKRYILDDGVHTLAFGHYKINLMDIILRKQLRLFNELVKINNV
jgi:hypothetical protein